MEMTFAALFPSKMKNLSDDGGNTMILATAYATFYRNIFRSNSGPELNDAPESTNCHS